MTNVARIASTLGLCLALAHLAGAQEVFNSKAEPECAPAEGLGDDPGTCDDPRIPDDEELYEATARLFPFVSSGSRQGEFGRWLETNGYVVTTGACQGNPGHLILFLGKDKVCGANRVNEIFNAGPDAPPDAPPNDRPGNAPRTTPISPPQFPPAGVPAGRPLVTGPGAGPCRPFGLGGYDWCQNPEGTRLPDGCVCDRGVPAPPRPLRTPIERDPAEAPCEMPAPADLARPPDDGDVAVAYVLAPDGGDIAVALALRADTTLTGGVKQDDVFTPPPKPLALQGRATVNGWPTLPDKPIRLQGFATQTLRVPVTYKPAQRKPSTITPQQKRTVQLVLTGGTDTYDPEVGKQRFITGFLQCMNKALKAETHYQGLVKVKPRGPPQSCSLEVPAGAQGRTRPTVQRAIDTPLDPKKPVATTGFITSAIDTVFKSNPTLQQYFPQLEKVVGIFGPVIDGADMLTSYKETLDKISARDVLLRKALDTVNGNDPRYASRELDPLDVGCLAGKDAADAYIYYVKTVVQLTLKGVPTIPKH
ncbi:MAG: hypothetical protein ABI640_19925 [Gammaproteobacteria bacterium]